MRRLGTKLGGKRGGRAMSKLFGKPGAVKSVSRLGSRGAGRGLLKGAGKGLLKGAGKGLLKGRWRIIKGVGSGSNINNCWCWCI